MLVLTVWSLTRLIWKGFSGEQKVIWQAQGLIRLFVSHTLVELEFITEQQSGMQLFWIFM